MLSICEAHSGDIGTGLDMTDHSPRVLVVLDSSVGDIVMNHTLLFLLKEHEPDLEIDVIAPSVTRGLTRRMPEVRQHIPLDIRSTRPLSRRWLSVARSLHKENYKQAILIPRSTSAASLLRFSQIQIRTGFKQVRPGLINDQRGNRPANFHQKITCLIPRDMALPGNLPYPCLRTDPAEITATAHKLKISPSRKPVIALAPGAARWDTKKWPLESYAELAGMLIPKYHICVVGGDQEVSIGQKIAADYPEDIINLCGKSSLDEAVDVIAGAKCVIANDSGLMHVAAAVRTPVVGIYGPTSPEAYPPLSDSREICWTESLCSPCYQNRCPYGHHACMKQITPQQVLDRVSKLVDTPEFLAMGNAD